MILDSPPMSQIDSPSERKSVGRDSMSFLYYCSPFSQRAPMTSFIIIDRTLNQKINGLVFSFPKGYLPMEISWEGEEVITCFKYEADWVTDVFTEVNWHLIKSHFRSGIWQQEIQKMNMGRLLYHRSSTTTCTIGSASCSSTWDRALRSSCSTSCSSEHCALPSRNATSFSRRTGRRASAGS